MHSVFDDTLYRHIKGNDGRKEELNLKLARGCECKREFPSSKLQVSPSRYQTMLSRISVSLLLLLAFPFSISQSKILLQLDREAPKSNYGEGHHGFPAEVRLYEEFSEEVEPTGFRGLLRRNKVVARWVQPQTITKIKQTQRRHLVDLLGGITKVGEYYTRVEIGGQQVRLQIDTGSSTMALPMAECDRCLAGDQRYDIKVSNSGIAHWISCEDPMCLPDTCRLHKCKRCSSRDACCAEENPSTCGFQLKYGDGSGARGALMKDTMTWGKNGSGSESVTAPVIFGGILHDSKDFQRSTVDGILGMAYKKLACNPTCVEPPFQQLVQSGRVKDAFEICISRDGGRLVLGERDPSMASSKMTFVPMSLTDPPTYYSVNISSAIHINQRQLNLPSFRHAVIDSGTTLIVVSEVVFLKILNHLFNHFCHIPGLCNGPKTWFKPASCIRLSEDTLKQLPTFRFTVGLESETHDLLLRPQDYMIQYHKHKKNFRCVGIMAMKKLSRGTDIILGNTLMQRYVTFYDRANKRIGFAVSKGTCGETSSVCSSYTQCEECAADDRCSYDFQTELCGLKHSGMLALAYPTCSGSSCLCTLGSFVGLFFGIIAGFAGSVAIGIGVIFWYFLWRQKKKVQPSSYDQPNESTVQEELLPNEADTTMSENP